MKYLNFALLLVLVACGRPPASNQQSTEVVQRQRFQTLTSAYKEVEGEYTGTLTLIEDNANYLAKLELRVVTENDPQTGLPLSPVLVGSLGIFEDENSAAIVTYGITKGSYDSKDQRLALEVSNTLSIRGEGDRLEISAMLQSTVKGDVGELKLERSP